MQQRDWGWWAAEGLVDNALRPILPQDFRANQLLVKGRKSLVIISHHYNRCCKKENTWTLAHVIEPDLRKGGVTLQMLSDALFQFIPKGSDFGLLEMKVNAEDDYSCVSFLYFDH